MPEKNIYNEIVEFINLFATRLQYFFDIIYSFITGLKGGEPGSEIIEALDEFNA